MASLLVAATEVPAVAAPEDSAVAGVGSGPVVRPDAVSAGIAARASGQRVEVEGMRTQTSSTWVNPDGSWTATQYLGQQRFRNGAGQWVGVDLKVAKGGDGLVRPGGHPLGVVLSGGRAGQDLVTVNAGPDASGVGRQVSVGWHGRLPAPVLEGSTVTYPDVKPGVDVKVQVLRTGFEQFFVVKDRAAVPPGGCRGRYR